MQFDLIQTDFINLKSVTRCTTPDFPFDKALLNLLSEISENVRLKVSISTDLIPNDELEELKKYTKVKHVSHKLNKLFNYYIGLLMEYNAKFDEHIEIYAINEIPNNYTIDLNMKHAEEITKFIWYKKLIDYILYKCER
jgi:hypothetical protein